MNAELNAVLIRAGFAAFALVGFGLVALITWYIDRRRRRSPVRETIRILRQAVKAERRRRWWAENMPKDPPPPPRSSSKNPE